MSKPEKLKWENKQAYEYRLKITDFSQKLHEALIEFEAAAVSLDGTTIKEKMTNCSNLAKGIKIIPLMYSKSHQLLMAAVEAYSTGIDLFSEGITENDAQDIYKAGRYVTEGNHYIGLAKIKMWEAIEKKHKH